MFGVPNPDLGEEVKAAVQLMPGNEPGPEMERELIAFCQEHLARQKCPRSVDFEEDLESPRFLAHCSADSGRMATALGGRVSRRSVSGRFTWT